MPVLLTESPVGPSPKPNGMASFGAGLGRAQEAVVSPVRRLHFGSVLWVGYIAKTSIPAICFSMLIRPTQFRFSVPVLEGNAIQ